MVIDMRSWEFGVVEMRNNRKGGAPWCEGWTVKQW